MIKNTLSISAILLALTACSSGNDGDKSVDNSASITPDVLSKGVFLDSAVGNVDYKTETRSGVTNAQGEFEYVAGETITFSLGALNFPVVSAGSKITPLTLASTDNVKSPSVVNILRLLQTLDQDSNPENGITITDQAKENAMPVEFDIDVELFAANQNVLNLVQNGGQNEYVESLIPESEAVQHFSNTLKQSELEFKSFAGIYTFASESIMFQFLNNNDYIALQWQEENGWVGVEKGRYSLSDSKVMFQALVNRDGEALFCSAPRGELCAEALTLTYELADTSLTFAPNSEEPFKIERLSFTENTIAGAWLMEGEYETQYLTLTSQGDFALVELDTEGGFEAGYEVGKYTFENDTLSLTITHTFWGPESECSTTEESPCDNAQLKVVLDNNTLGILEDNGEIEVEFTRLF
ncbi:hypothetical protein [Pseudoalteromonas byunsanensis]|uniref:Carboxypeptidase regulatory-like domain-containing protein n=1 Tax=Pseudoalteromonas byunsanensis TaxID=327939 RepID=A0A1S1NAQ7_9GAMM|nr:hypothetical protein [Pseudoalteromonas byunsanensis]OHU96466.1 hypothetical protein BIW53_03820 [Pseudoalteromonas byunsanensis]